MRIIQPEILDSIEVGDPDAIASRRDLRLINRLMGNFRWIVTELAKHLEADDRILELGAGDGTLGRRVFGRFPDLGRRYTALDLAPRPCDWPAEFGWLQADLWSREGAAAFATANVVVANLILHHFDDTRLEHLGGMLGNTRLLVLCEPARREIHVWQGRLLASVGRLNRVTRHDLPVSVRAGFRSDELLRAIRLDRAEWTWRVHSTWLGAYRVVATIGFGTFSG